MSMHRKVYIWSLILFGIPWWVLGAVMQSSSYRIQSDSVNMGGGLASSTGYTIESTAGEVATGDASSTSYRVHGGYQQMQATYISISASAGIVMSSLLGITSASSTGSSTWTVITDDPAGYVLTVRATSTPALKTTTGDSFGDYTEAGNPDFAFSIVATSSAFGFSPEGIDITTFFKDNGSTCNTGLLDTVDACWVGFSTTDRTIAQSNTANQPTGATTTIKVRAENGASHTQNAGVYNATLVLTALAL